MTYHTFLCTHRLASINCIPFTSQSTDADCMAKLYREMSSIFVDRVKVQMRHGTSKEVAKSTPFAGDKLAPVPTTVPELPEVMTPRPAVVSEMRASVLGFLSSGTVSLSSVKKSKVQLLFVFTTYSQNSVLKRWPLTGREELARPQWLVYRISHIIVGETTYITSKIYSVFCCC